MEVIRVRMDIRHSDQKQFHLIILPCLPYPLNNKTKRYLCKSWKASSIRPS